MKKLIALVLVAFPFVAWGADCPLPEDCYTDRMTYEIMDSQGNVVDRIVYDRNVGLPYEEALALKYVRMFRIAEGGAKTFLDILSLGSSKEALKKELAP